MLPVSYDLASHSTRMCRRLLAALVFGLVTVLGVHAQPVWSGAARPPREGLPLVQVSAGYPGGYVPASNFPIELEILGGDRPFDGHVGFHLAAGTLKTLDHPVLTRVRLGVHQRERFTTFGRMGIFRRTDGTIPDLERRSIVVEWRDRDLRLLATAAAGIPPWVADPLPLRIARHGEQVDPHYLGQTAVVIPVAGLGTEPQWYAGFSNVLAPLDLWFSLETPVREAVFASTTWIVLFGAPQRLPVLDDVDRAVLPVEFLDEPGTLQPPWPYDGEQRSVPVSWRARNQASFAGAESSPYLVEGQVATFAADEETVRVPLPQFFADRRAVWDNGERKTRFDAVRFVSESKDVLLFVALLITALPVWLIMRRRPTWPRAAALVTAAGLIVAARGSLTVSQGVDSVTVSRVLAPGVISTSTRIFADAPSPLPELQTTDSRFKGVTRSARETALEVRQSSTPAGFGSLHEPAKTWISASRFIRRNELAETPRVTIAPHSSPKAIVVTWESHMPVEYVTARWLCGEVQCVGESRVGSKTRGEVTLHHGTILFPPVEMPFWNVPDGSNWFASPHAEIALVKTSAPAKMIRIEDPPGTPKQDLPYSMATWLHPRSAGLSTATLQLPAPIPADAEATVRILDLIRDDESAATAITVRSASGALRVERAAFENQRARLRDLGSIAPEGGLVRIEVETSRSLTGRQRVILSVKKRKP